MIRRKFISVAFLELLHSRKCLSRRWNKLPRVIANMAGCDRRAISRRKLVATGGANEPAGRSLWVVWLRREVHVGRIVN